MPQDAVFIIEAYLVLSDVVNYIDRLFFFAGSLSSSISFILLSMFLPISLRSRTAHRIIYCETGSSGSLALQPLMIWMF